MRNERSEVASVFSSKRNVILSLSSVSVSFPQTPLISDSGACNHYTPEVWGITSKRGYAEFSDLAAVEMSFTTIPVSRVTKARPSTKAWPFQSRTRSGYW